TTKASLAELGEQLESGDEAYVLEAFNDLETMWRWTGTPTSNDQPAQWPRIYVPKPGWAVPGEPGWSAPGDDSDWLAYSIRFLRGTSITGAFLDSQTVPESIKVAQALIALLRKKEGNLIGDTQDDSQGLQIGSLKVAYVNAIRQSADIHKRTAQLGSFIGDGLVRA
ncbi:MAG: hypothetical protein K2X80_04070, partial [Pseudomonadaceae bacterium]|nr:hypothetical protein [Pseudomonadaceae bacterium]